MTVNGFSSVNKFNGIELNPNTPYRLSIHRKFICYTQITFKILIVAEFRFRINLLLLAICPSVALCALIVAFA